MEDNINYLDDIEIVKEFLIESNDHLDSIESKILTLEKYTDNLDIINSIFRSLHSIKGSSGFLDLQDICKVSHELETILDETRKSKIKISPDIIETLYEGVDILRRLREIVVNKANNRNASNDVINIYPLLLKISTILKNNQTMVSKKGDQNNALRKKHLGEILVETGDISKDQLEQVLQEQERWKRLGAILVEKGITTTEKIEKALKIQSVLGKPPPDTIKVDTLKLDTLITLVEELVLTNSHIHKTLKNNNGEVDYFTHLSKIIKDIQEQVLGMRMIAIKSTFQKMARLVRDISMKLKKKVRLEIVGEDVVLDKIVVEEISDPLVHIVRNAIDHGIEPYEERVIRGKSVEGMVRMNAFYQNGNIVIEIEDDGRGLCKEKIIKKASEKGLVDANATLTDQQIYNLIFSAGFSTADKITDVSGRGVGMDVVKINVENLGGTVTIFSVEGKGTKISLKLPLTLAIIDGMIVESGAERYVVPMLSLKESICTRKENISTVEQCGELITVRGNLLPLVRLDKLYNAQPKKMNPEDSYILIVENEGQQCGILVDNLLGKKQILIKRHGEQFPNIQGVSGYTILGDGQMGMVLDISSIVNMSLNKQINTRNAHINNY